MHRKHFDEYWIQYAVDQWKRPKKETPVNEIPVIEEVIEPAPLKLTEEEMKKQLRNATRDEGVLFLKEQMINERDRYRDMKDKLERDQKDLDRIKNELENETITVLKGGKQIRIRKDHLLDPRKKL